MYKLECDALLFDLDGVLIDSTNNIERHWRDWARENGLEFAAIMAVAHGKRTVETMRLVAPHLDCDAEAERLTTKEVADSGGVTPTPGASSLLKKLPPDAWAVVTSASRKLATARLQYVGLPLPETLITGDDVKEGKPAPEPYLLAAMRMGLPLSGCVVVEDSPAGLSSARGARMRVIAIATTHKKSDLADGDVVIDGFDGMRVSLGGPGGPRLVIGIPRNRHQGA
jgi:sugar-phosphatase